MTLIAHSVAEALRRSTRKGSRLSLTSAQAAVLMSPSVYQAISMLEAAELNALCQDNERTAGPQLRAVNGTSSDPISCGIEPTVAIGASAGMSQPQMEVSVGHAASRLASAAVMQVTRQKKLRTH
jgi:hypothetical protein